MQPKCACGIKAKWFYAPAKLSDKIENIVFCNTCIPRGCSCSDYNFEDISKEDPSRVKEVIYDGGYKAYRYLTDDGLEEPCCEFDLMEKESDWDWFNENENK
jgi:hypothetical protein